jgi:SPP1 family predicted phage head-tail adaptor
MSGPVRFNRRLSLESPVEEADGAGGVTRTYEQIALLWAAVTPLTASAEIAADARGAKVTHRIVIRAGRTVSSRDRFTEGARIYRVIAARESDDRRLIEITAEQQTD